MDYLTPDFATDLGPGDFSTPDRPPFPPTSESPLPYFYRSHSHFQYASLTVLCCGTIALVMICWKCCRKSGAKETVSQSAVGPPSEIYNNNVELTGIPPPPYTATYSIGYEEPPPYSKVYEGADQDLHFGSKVQNKECRPGNAAGAVNHSAGIHFIKPEIAEA